MNNPKEPHNDSLDEGIKEPHNNPEQPSAELDEAEQPAAIKEPHNSPE